MSRKTIAAIGGIQPLLFCVGMYLMALFFSMFVCSSIFYAINPRKASPSNDMVVKSQNTTQSVSADGNVLASIK